MEKEPRDSRSEQHISKRIGGQQMAHRGLVPKLVHGPWSLIKDTAKKDDSQVLGRLQDVRSQIKAELEESDLAGAREPQEQDCQWTRA